MKTGLVIPIYNRPQYVRECFDSLRKITTKPDYIILIDDASTDKDIKPLCDAFCNDIGAIYLFMPKNSGVRACLEYGINQAIAYGCETIINLDSDSIVRRDFIEVLLKLKKEHSGHIVSGFNCVTAVNPVIAQHKNYCYKGYVNGINMCFDAAQYHKYIEPALQTVGNWDYNTSLACQKDKLHMVVSSPSVVQHIGAESSMGHTANGIPPDMAQDFISLCLPDVTLFGIDAHDPEGIKRAADICQRNIQFGAVNIITERLFPGRTTNEGRANYSRFMIKDLHKHFKTSHVLTIHTDGYIVNANAWKDSWLQYDYIGATWGYKDNMNVGNGGFSLRSKRLCEILAKDDHISDLHPEDDRICRMYRPYLEKKYGIRFAPEDVANEFSIEAYGAHVWPSGNHYTGQFGFHSKHVNFIGSEIPKEIRL